MREGWEVKALDDLCSFSNGLWKGKKPPYINVGVIRNTNFTKEGFLDDTNIAYLDVEEKQFSSRSLYYGDIILEKSGGGPKQAVGRVIIFNKASGDFSFSNFTAAIRVNDPDILEARFLHKYLHWQYLSGVTERMQSHSTGIRNLKLNEYKSIEIPLPPLAEQKRIVAVLDQAFAGIEQALAAARKNLASARELFETTLNATFTQKGEGWVEMTLGEVCVDFGRGKSKHRPRNEPALYGGETPFIQTGDLSGSDHYVTTFEKTYSKVGVKQSKVWPIGTVCVAIVGATIGESAILTFEACFPDSVIGMTPDPQKSDSEFIEYLLQFFKAELKEAGKGSARDNINLKTFSDRLFRIPNLEQQLAEVKKISNVSTEVKKLEALYKRKIDALNELKQSLLQKAFAGELTRELTQAKEDATL